MMLLISSFNGLLMNFATEKKANIVIRGLRAVSDFEYEFQMAGMNYKINTDIETIFLMASDKFQLIFRKQILLKLMELFFLLVKIWGQFRPFLEILQKGKSGY